MKAGILLCAIFFCQDCEYGNTLFLMKEWSIRIGEKVAHLYGLSLCERVSTASVINAGDSL